MLYDEKSFDHFKRNMVNSVWAILSAIRLIELGHFECYSVNRVLTILSAIRLIEY